jgi:hypothetical protein
MKSLKPLTKSWSVLEWVASNKLVLNIFKTKSIVFGTNHSISARPQLNLVMNGVDVEKVEETKLLGVTLDCKLSWSTYRFNGCKDGERSSRNKEMMCFFDTTLQKAGSAGSIFCLILIIVQSCCKERPS